MESGAFEDPEPTHWFWYEDDGGRAVVVAFGCLVASGPLGHEELEAIDLACRRGRVFDADFGPDAILVDLAEVRAVRFVTARRCTVLVLGDGRRYTLEPEPVGPDPAREVAREVFDHLAALLGRGVEPREGFVSAKRTSVRRHDGRVPAALGAVAVALLAVSAWADPDRISSGPLSGLVQATNDFFVSVGWLSLLFVLAGLIVAEVVGFARTRAATSRRLAALQIDVYPHAVSSYDGVSAIDQGHEGELSAASTYMEGDYGPDTRLDSGAPAPLNS